MTPEGLFEPTVIFFGLTNSPIIFQTIMNKILSDLINTKKVTSFIDDIIIETEKKEGHNQVVDEVVKKLAENNIYVKQEKCKEKIRKVEFLGVVIGLERIKIKEENVKNVLDWPTLNEVQDVQKFLRL